MLLVNRTFGSQVSLEWGLNEGLILLALGSGRAGQRGQGGHLDYVLTGGQGQGSLSDWGIPRRLGGYWPVGDH